MNAELSRAESELQNEENALHAELTRLLATGDEIAARLATVRETASKAASHGLRDAGLEARLKAAKVPDFDPDAAFADGIAAREAALQSRRASTAAARQQLAQLKETFATLAREVATDEKAAEKLAGLAKQKVREAAAAPAVAIDETLKPGTVPAVSPPLKPKKVAPPPPPRAAVDHDAKRGLRTSARVKMQASVDLHSDNNFFNGFSSNISDGGLFVATVNLLPIGTPIDLTFSLPTGERISAHGLVRWVREVNDQLPDSFPGLGIQFTNLNDESQSAIDTFVSSREPLFYAE